MPPLPRMPPSPPPVDRMTDACENITFRQLLLRAVMNVRFRLCWSESEVDIASRWVHRESNLMFTLAVTKIKEKRMHSSRMRTARSLTVCRSRGICPGGACMSCTHPPGHARPMPFPPRMPPPCGQNHRRL